MSGVNKAILVGNVGKDPEFRRLNDGSEVCNLSLATSEIWRDKSSGERREKTEWHRIVVFNDNLVTVIKNYVKKGSKLYVEGAIQTREWQDQSGNKKYATEIVLKFNGVLQMLNNVSGDGDGGPRDSRDNQGERRGAKGGSFAQPKTAVEDPDDQIPF